MEYSPNILQNSPTGHIHVIRGIEPLVQDIEPEQPVSSSVIQSRGAVRNKTPLLGQAFHHLSSPCLPRTAHCCPLCVAYVSRVFTCARVTILGLVGPLFFISLAPSFLINPSRPPSLLLIPTDLYLFKALIR